MRPLLLLLATLLATLTASAQIEQGDVSICEGESVTLSIAEPEGASNAFSNSNSLDFGSGDFVRIPIAPELTDFSEVTIEFWYYQISRGEEFIVATEYFNTGWGFHNENPNVLQWRVEGGPYSLGGSNFPIPYNEWMHVAGVYDGSELRLYANGTLVASEAYSGTISDSRNEDIVINRHVWASGSSSRLTGQLDELRISNVARYDGDFTPPSIAFEPDGNTLALYHFDEASGSMIQDASGNGHNGNISGTSWSSNLPFSSGSTTSTPTILWSTGETTSSISLSPASSQTVSVTVSESSNDFTDEVTVTVEDCTPATPDYVPTDGLVAWYPLDGDATDVGPNNIGHDYFSATATTNRFGEAGSALLFNGTTDWIQGDSELFPQNDRTIAFWAKFLQDGTELWMTGYGGGPIGYGTVIYANSNQCNVFNAIGHSEHGCQGTFQVPYSSIPDDQWVHIAMTSDPSTARFYINGVEQSSRAGLGEVITSGVHYYIGSSPSYNGVDNLSTGSFTGSMDDIGFWNRALTPTEILALASLAPIPGCTDATACNYNSDATQDDASCDLCGCLQPPTVVAGFSTNYLLASDGILTGWGTNNMDQTSIPADLPRIIKADAAEEYVIWLDEDQNVTIQGGNGPYSNSVPAGLQGIDVAAGRHHMVVVKTDGSLLSLGANYTGLQNEPVVNNAIQGAAGWYHNAAVLDDGSVVGWGDNWSAPANPITNAVAIDAGVDHTLVLKDDFTVEEWGNNINSASAWSGLTNVVDIAAGGQHSLAIMSDGSMKAWNASNGNIIFESAPGAFVLDADIDWGSMILLYADGSLETTLTPPAEALAFSDNWDGCDLCASDADGDGICNENDNACFANANLPVFSSISVVEPASGTSSSDATVELDLTGGNPFSLELNGLNGSDDLSLSIPTGLSLVPAGFYLARVLDANGCAAVSSAPGGSTAGQDLAELPIIVNYTLCCGGCGIYDADADGICDDVDNCTDRTASNYADPANVPCGCNEPVEYQGYAYDVVQIGAQCWFSENLRIETYRNGDPIPFYEADADWSNAHQTSEGAWCHPNGDASKSLSYGHMYNHWLIMDGRDVCPQGWHVPTDGDFIELEMFMGMPLDTALETGWRGADQGVRLKASPSSSIPWDGTDEVGFQWVQGGWRHVSGAYGYIDDLGLLMFTPSEESEGAAYGIRQAGNQFQPGGLVRSFGGNAGDGRSLRCVRD